MWNWEVYAGMVLGRIVGTASDPVIILAGLLAGLAAPRRLWPAMAVALAAGVGAAIIVPIMTANWVRGVGLDPWTTGVRAAPFRIISTVLIFALPYGVRLAVLRLRSQRP